MRHRLHAALLLASLLLAGCTFGQGGEESTDPGSYVDGPGAALSVENRGDKPVRVDLRILNGRGAVVGEGNFTVEAGKTVERKFPLDPADGYVARMGYNLDADGEAAAGADEQRFDAGACPELTRLSWRLLRTEGTTGSQFIGKECAAAP